MAGINYEQSNKTGFAAADRPPCGHDAETASRQPRGERGERGRLPRRGFAALLLASCVGASSLFGFLGGYAANRTQGAYAASPGTEILYQSAIRPVSVSDVLEGGAMTVAETAAAVKDVVVEITTEIVSRNGRMGQLINTGAGSGVIVSSDGYIVTNNHVVSGAQSITVRLTDGNEYAATVRGMDSKTDLAVLKIGATGLTPAVLGDSSRLAAGDQAVVIGNPLGELGGTVTGGIISALDREINIDGETISLLQTDAAVNPGNSGGGMFNLYGELVGVVNAKSSGLDIEGIGFAIPVNMVKTVVDELISNGYVKGRLDTGLTLVDIQNAQTAMMYRVNQLGLYISKSSDDAFRSGDRIIAVNGTAVGGLSDFNAAISGLLAGDTIEITVLRGGKSVTAVITLTELRS
ncbi:MAG: trypsin-like peptidase domain-containing protein [Clostridiales Family XIII bacterium]|jgi:serine protease Do|nr:trypsin-like peptidase domain-containing protein [Clostridiales Family XIII bacterium]